MSRISDYNLMLQEQAEQLGFSTTQEALDAGYVIDNDRICRNSNVEPRQDASNTKDDTLYCSDETPPSKANMNSLNKYSQLEQGLSRAKTAHDMMDIILTSLDVARRNINKLKIVESPNESMRIGMRVIEGDIKTMQSELADYISDTTDLLKKLKEKSNEN